jgi:hypothetical protein
VNADFVRRVELVTGLSYGDAVILGRAQEEERQRRIRAAGYCCEAGAVAHPDACPWHPLTGGGRA